MVEREKQDKTNASRVMRAHVIFLARRVAWHDAPMPRFRETPGTHAVSNCALVVSHPL